MRLLSTCLPTVPHSTEKIKATQLLTSEFYENISAKSYTHAMHLNNIYKEYTELHTEKENENEN